MGADEQEQPSRPALVRLTPEELREELLPILRAGLPVTFESVGPHWPYFPIVTATAVGRDLVHRIIAFDELLTAIIQDLGTTKLGHAVGVLFGLPPADRSWSLARRQAEAANVAGYSTDHFRKHVQSRLLDDIVLEFIRRNARYRPRVLEQPVPPEGVFSLAAPDEEADLELLELQARLAAEVYAVRAEVLATRRLAAKSVIATQDRSLAGLWHYARLQNLKREFAENYGELVLARQGSEAFDHLILGLDMQGPFTEKDLGCLRLTAATSANTEVFQESLSACSNCADLVAKWLDWASS